MKTINNINTILFTLLTIGFWVGIPYFENLNIEQQWGLSMISLLLGVMIYFPKSIFKRKYFREVEFKVLCIFPALIIILVSLFVFFVFPQFLSNMVRYNYIAALPILYQIVVDIWKAILQKKKA